MMMYRTYITTGMNNIERQVMVRMNGLADRLRTFGFTDKEREALLVRLLLYFFSDKNDPAPGPSLSDGEGRPGFLTDFSSDVFSVDEFPLHRCTFDEDFLREIDECRKIPWDSLSPSIFGAMFQDLVQSTPREGEGSPVGMVNDPALREDRGSGETKSNRLRAWLGLQAAE